MEKKKQPCAEIMAALGAAACLPVSMFNLASLSAPRRGQGAIPACGATAWQFSARRATWRGHTLHVEEKHGTGFSPAGRLAGIKRRIAA